MRIAELIAPGRFRLVEAPAPEPAPGEVQVRVSVVGVCGSDLHSFCEGRVGDAPCCYPMVLGHEPAGMVVKAGAGVRGWQAGDRVALEPAIYCYHCEFCRSGHHNVCANLRFLSQPGDPGFFRDLVNLPAANLLALPPDIGLREATMFEPLAVVLHALRLAQLQRGETAAVFGAGPMGLLTVAALKLSGAGRIWAIEPVAHRRQMALAAGADAALDPAGGDAARQILADTANRGADVAIDCATKDGSIADSLRVTRSAGRVAVVGIPSELRTELDFHVMRRKELTLLHVRRSNGESRQALDLLREHAGLFAPMITHARPLEEIEAAFAMLAAYAHGVGKLVMQLN
jgi:L-iditol 2-dehydrogenase